MNLMQKLEAEYNNYWKENKDDCFIVSPIDESNIYTWSIKFKGPKDSPYERGIFHLKVDFPNDYPFKYPQIKFITPISS